ncbi:MAG: Glucoamylase, intracellular sporulation-specific [Chaenotheca gracillima]|nr:MAG: Glucoamylase, intracellular sporulation-specific [Chaenotheca gracillima]
MYTKQVLLFALAAVVPALAQDGVITCQTTDGSPTTEDVTGVINQLKGRASDICGNDNNAGSHCTTLATQGTAAIARCGTDTLDNAGTPDYTCGQIAEYAEGIQGACINGDLIGGTNTVEMDSADTDRVEVIHS